MDNCHFCLFFHFRVLFLPKKVEFDNYKVLDSRSLSSYNITNVHVRKMALTKAVIWRKDCIIMNLSNLYS